MKIAIPHHLGEVNQHFGQSKWFAIIEIDSNSQIISVEDIETGGLQHQHEGLAELLTNQGIEVVIVGGIGAGALQALEDKGLKVLFGASGPVKNVAETFARGEFVSKRKLCNHHGHGSHHHGDGKHHHGGCSH